MNSLQRTLPLIITLFLMLSSSAQLLGVDALKLHWNWVICHILCLILFIAGGISALVILMAGLKYLSSESPGQSSEAKRRILYAVIGLILVFLATPFVNYLVNSFSPGPEEFICWCSTLTGNFTGSDKPPLEVRIIFPGEESIFENDTPINFQGQIVVGGDPKYEYEWSSAPPGIERRVSKSGTSDTFSQDLNEGGYRIILKVTDDEGQIAIDSVRIKIIVP